MANDSETLTYQLEIPVTPAEIYRAFTNSTALREWFCDTATTSPRTNGHLFVGWNNGYYATGHFTELLENRAACFTWQGRGEPRPTQVSITIEATDAGSQLTLEHSGIGDTAEWGDKPAEFDRSWRRALENLASVLTTGEDLRVTRRPMLGVLLANFTADDAARLGVPVMQGVRLSGVVPGLGAESAGLRQDDVIISVDGLSTADVVSLRSALSSRLAGDSVTIEFYRGGVLHRMPMTLSGRKMPAIPATTVELAARVAARYAQDAVRLNVFLAGVDDMAASLRPGPDDWSIKQVMAHLIQGERYNHQWIGELVGGHEGAYDDFAGNQEVRLNATIHAFPTLADMRAELERLNAETVSLLENLPEEFVRRKRSFWRLARTFLDESYSHIDDHMNQMRAALDAAQASGRP